MANASRLHCSFTTSRLAAALLVVILTACGTAVTPTATMTPSPVPTEPQRLPLHTVVIGLGEFSSSIR